MTALIGFIGKVVDNIINPFIVLLFAMALVYFFWGLVQFIAGADDETKRGTGKKHMVWGVIGLVIMIGVFGIINILLNTFGIPSLNISK